jgi:hypothetical protein
VANGVVFVGVGDNGVVHAFDAATGTHLWDSTGAAGGSTFAAPIVSRGSVYAASWNGSGSADAGTVRAFVPGAPPPPPGPVVLLGDQAVEPQLDSNAMGQAEAFQATGAASGTLSSMSVYVDGSSTTTKLVVGLYADAGGHPGALLAQGSSTTLRSGAWNSVPVTPAAVVAGSSYWIAVLGTQSGTLRFRDRARGCRSETSSQKSLTALPGSWATGTVYSDCPLSAYGSS